MVLQESLQGPVAHYDSGRKSQHRAHVISFIRHPGNAECPLIISVSVFPACHILSHDLFRSEVQIVSVDHTGLSFQKIFPVNFRLYCLLQVCKFFFADPDHDRAEIFGMFLIFFPLFLIGNVHPFCVGFFHPHLREIRFPGHRDLPVREGIDFRDSADALQIIQKRLCQQIFMFFGVLLFQCVIDDRQVIVHMVGHNSPGALAFQQSSHAQKHRHSRCQRDHDHRSFPLILPNLIQRQPHQDPAASRTLAPAMIPVPALLHPPVLALLPAPAPAADPDPVCPVSCVICRCPAVSRCFHRGDPRRQFCRLSAARTDGKRRQRHRQKQHPRVQGNLHLPRHSGADPQ